MILEKQGNNLYSDEVSKLGIETLIPLEYSRNISGGR